MKYAPLAFNQNANNALFLAFCICFLSHICCSCSTRASIRMVTNGTSRTCTLYTQTLKVAPASNPFLKWFILGDNFLRHFRRNEEHVCTALSGTRAAQVPGLWYIALASKPREVTPRKWYALCVVRLTLSAAEVGLQENWEFFATQGSGSSNLKGCMYDLVMPWPCSLPRYCTPSFHFEAVTEAGAASYPRVTLSHSVQYWPRALRIASPNQKGTCSQCWSDSDGLQSPLDTSRLFTGSSFMCL